MLEMKIGQLPWKKYSVLIVPVPKYIIGIDILKVLTLNLSEGQYQFGVKPYFSVKTVIVGKVKMPPVELPSATKVISLKQYRIPGGGGHKEIGETIQDLLNAGVLKTTITAWNNPVWPVKKLDGSWRMTVDYQELNKYTPPLTAAVPDTITLIENIQKHQGTCYAAIDLANAFFTIPFVEENYDQFAFTWQGRQYTFTRLPQGYLHCPTICHKIVAEHLDKIRLPQNMQIYHYIDDILIQGNSEQEVSEYLQIVINHMRIKGWEINPNKIQGPAQTVTFLGIQWHQGHREILPKAKQKILEFPTPQEKMEAQRFIGLFGFWRQHIPHLSPILSPLYKVTRKKYEFVWGDDQQKAFEQGKQAIQKALDLWPLQDREVELHVSVQNHYANWSRWQKQGSKREPLGFWTRKLPDAVERYPPFGKQLQACYWALVDTEQMTVGHTVLLRPEIPIMQWVMISSKMHRLGHAQEASIIKWKWYIHDRAKPGINGVAMLHEKVAQIPIDQQLSVTDKAEPVSESPVKWGMPYVQVTLEQCKHVWFTDGSAKYVGNKRCWKAVSYNPVTKRVLTSSGSGKSSQYAELYAVYQALKQETPGISFYTDSWSVANGLATWLPTWQKNDWKIHLKKIWGKELWQLIWEMINQGTVTVYHVDAHCSADSLKHWFNSVTDEQTRISEANIPDDSEQMGMAKWAHQKCGHLGEKATYRWTQMRGIALSLDLIKTVILECLICEHTQQRSIPHMVQGHIGQGKLPGQIRQIDYVVPLPLNKGCQYIYTEVDTYSGYLIGFSCRRATQDSSVDRDWDWNSNSTKHFGWTVPQSTLALKGVQVVNGVIEASYQGELKIILLNTSDENVHVQKKDRVAQIFIVPVLGSSITRGQSSPVTTFDREQISSMHEINSCAKIWFHEPNKPPEEAEVIAAGNDNTVLIIKPEKEKLEYIPADWCYLRE
ncbi:LOW QUALITY PROTEIN: uncharacterized protein LOC122816080 [Protopterus annectens]|uniref:LOW QUALITY PROTEIN: uncharacterized protein LOC122816080 n=1 Tax=Protopterus annectens TaxID=7888 RepID=UPI001CFB86EE|nr:LOW QUALITY PROTEIN: uncharacterized protein LOC122816080 [Protopterus annectens]